MGTFQEELARLEARALRCIESSKTALATRGRATRGILIPIVEWLESERAAGGDPGPALEAFTDCIAQAMVMVSHMASPDNQSAMVGVEAILERARAVAHNFTDKHADRLEEAREP